jgi:SOS-response transcriptional repressor LexA
MSYASILKDLRKASGLTQKDVAEFLSSRSSKPITLKTVSHWETIRREIPVEQFLLLCELYNVADVLGTFLDAQTDRGISKLNKLGERRVTEYISLLLSDPKYRETPKVYSAEPVRIKLRTIRLYDAPVAAGAGLFLDSDSYTEIEADGTVPADADYAVRVSGDSMLPRFTDGQIVFIKEQQTLDIGDIGIFSLNGEAYIKKLGHGELISLNTVYKPIELNEYDSIHIFGKVVG